MVMVIKMLELEILYAGLCSQISRPTPFWSVSVNPSTGSSDELHVSGQQVVWYEGLNPATRTVKKVYSVDTDVLQAFWCQFRGVKGQRKEAAKKDTETGGVGEEEVQCVCVRESRCLTLFMQTGAVHYVSLPFLVHHVWPIRGGVLVERQVDQDGGYDGLPTLFTLLHPMDDFCPVTCRRPAATTPAVSVLGFCSDPHVQVMGVSNDGDGEPLAITYDFKTRKHSIWLIQTATQNDIPAHLATPQHSNVATTPQNPLSSSAPSLYGNQTTPHTLMDTPVEMILSSKKQLPMDPLKHPALAQLRRPTPLGSGGKLHSTGRSPFISRLQTPQSGAAQFMRKRSKSLSPPVLARVSPFSQTVNSRSWSTFYSEELSFGNTFEPLVPQLCLHRVWVEPETQETSSQAIHHTVASLFKTSDLIRHKYLSMMVPSLSQLWLLGYDVIPGESPSFGQLMTVSAVQAVPMENHSMMLVLKVDGDLVLYSGPKQVSTINVQSLGQPLSLSHGNKEDDQAMDSSSATSVTGIRDPLGNNLTIILNSGQMLRCSLPLLYRHPVVSLCLQTVCELLPAAISHQLLSSYYTSSHQLSCSSLLSHFSQWLLISLNGPQERCASSGGEHSTPWEAVESLVNEKMISSVPALGLFCDPLEISQSKAEHSLTITSTVSLQEYKPIIAYGLHLAYEELKLNSLLHESLSSLADLLHRLVSQLGWQLYRHHYERDFPSLVLKSYATTVSDETMDQGLPPPSTIAIPSSPPHILHWLYQRLRIKETSSVFPVLPAVCKRTLSMVKLYLLYTTPDGKVADLSSAVEVLGRGTNFCPEQFTSLQERTSSPYKRVVLGLVEEGITLSELETYPVGVALPLWDSIVHSQESPPSFWPTAAYDIIGRSDVGKSLSVTRDPSPLKMENPEKCDDGMNIDQEVLRLRFPKDLRVNEARRMLSSSKPVRIALTQKPEVSDHDFLEQQETRLLATCQRTMALPVGRGMFSLSSAQPLPTAPLAIPELNLSGRAPPRNATVGLDHVDKPADMTQWAEFHNGVAAGLKIASSISELDSTWIIFNRPSKEGSANEYAGFLMALGFNGHLSSLQDYDLYNYLREKHELTVIGLLLGISAAKAGSMSASHLSLLALHFPPLLPIGAADMEVSQSIQTAAIIGVGLLYLGSANRHMVEVTLREIGHSPGPELEFAENRESYSLAAGMALGMITLGCGGNCIGLSDLHLVDQLCIFMNGGPKSEVSMATQSGTSQLVLESDQVNTHVTAAGAIIALGLMHLKTNDITIATTMDAPSTMYKLDCIRADFHLLRAFSRGLVMWDSIEPTQEWINSHIPPIVQNNAFKSVVPSADFDPTLDYQTLSQTHSNIVAGCCLAIAIRFAGTCDKLAYNCLLTNARGFLTRLGSLSAEQAGKICLENCLDTVVLALAVVMCGSGDLEVLKLIRRLHVRVGHPEVHYGSHMATHMALGLLFLGGGRYSLKRTNVAIATLVCALYPIFPNSSTDNRYHLQALRHLYVLAVEPRLLVTRNIRTNEACPVNVCVTSNGRERKMLTPCILPEWEVIEKITVCSEEFWPIQLDISDTTRQALSMAATIFVKQRTAHKNELTGRSLSTQIYGIGKVKGTVQLPCNELTTNPQVKTFCQQLSQLDSQWSHFLTAALLECIQKEKLQVLTTYLQLEQTIQSLSHFPELATLHLWQLKLVQASPSTLISTTFINTLLLRVKSWLETTAPREDSLDNLLKWYLFPDERGQVLREVTVTKKEVQLLNLMLVLYDIPSPQLLQITPTISVPDLYMKMNSMQAPVTAVVRIKSVLQEPEIPGF